MEEYEGKEVEMRHSTSVVSIYRPADQRIRFWCGAFNLESSWHARIT